MEQKNYCGSTPCRTSVSGASGDLEAELAVLACVLLDLRNFDAVSAVLELEDFAGEVTAPSTLRFCVCFPPANRSTSRCWSARCAIAASTTQRAAFWRRRWSSCFGRYIGSRLAAVPFLCLGNQPPTLFAGIV